MAALGAIPLWLATKTPLYAMLLITLIDALAFYPTFRKSWENPDEETLSAYALAALKFTISLAAMAHYNLITVLYPASLVVMNLAFVVYVSIRRSRLRRIT